MVDVGVDTGLPVKADVDLHGGDNTTSSRPFSVQLPPSKSHNNPEHYPNTAETEPRVGMINNDMTDSKSHVDETVNPEPIQKKRRSNLDFAFPAELLDKVPRIRKDIGERQ
jgi:hypothetical protein